MDRQTEVHPRQPWTPLHSPGWSQTSNLPASPKGWYTPPHPALNICSTEFPAITNTQLPKAIVTALQSYVQELNSSIILSNISPTFISIKALDTRSEKLIPLRWIIVQNAEWKNNSKDGKGMDLYNKQNLAWASAKLILIYHFRRSLSNMPIMKLLMYHSLTFASCNDLFKSVTISYWENVSIEQQSSQPKT